MSVASYLTAVACLLIVILSAIAFGQALRRWLVPDWDGAIGVLAIAVAAEGLLIVVAEALGTAGQLRRLPLVVAVAAVAVVARTLGPPASFRVRVGVRRPLSVRPATVLATLCVAAVAAQVLVAIYATGHVGITSIDSIEYHLSFASHFASTARTTTLVHVSPGDPTSYYPLNDELLNGIGMVLFHRDSLSLLLTVWDLGLAMLGAYAFGAEFGSGPVALCAVTPLLALLGVLDAQAGNDWAAVAPLIAMAVFVVRASRTTDRELDLRTVALIGIAGGLAIGTKLYLIAPVLALGLGLLLLHRHRLMSRAGVLVLGGLLSGGYWYVRDTIAVGSPIPGTHIRGLARVPMSIDAITFSVAHYLGDGSVWRHYFVPGLRLYFGDGWPAFVLLAAAGIALAPVGWRRDQRRSLTVLGVVAVISLIAYVVTPSTALGAPGMPGGFWENLRYALPVMVLGLLLAAVARPSIRWPTVTALIFTALLAVSLTWQFAWQAGTHRDPAIAVAVCLVLGRLLYVDAVRNHAGLAAVAVLVVLVVAGYPIQQSYLRDRYRTQDSRQDTLVSKLANRPGIRVGIGGRQAQYPFEGPTFANPVAYLGQSLPHHAFEAYTSCPAWRRAVDRARDNVVVIEDAGPGRVPAVGRWTATDPFARLEFRNSFGSIFLIRPGFGTAAC